MLLFAAVLVDRGVRVAVLVRGSRCAALLDVLVLAAAQVGVGGLAVLLLSDGVRATLLLGDGDRAVLLLGDGDRAACLVDRLDALQDVGGLAVLQVVVLSFGSVLLVRPMSFSCSYHVSGVSSRLIVVVGQPAHRAVCSHAPHAARRGALSLRRQTDRCLVHKFCLFYFVVFTHARRAL